MMERLPSDKNLPITREQKLETKLSDDQSKTYFSTYSTSLPVDNWSNSFWSCRGEFHSAFNCPYMYTDQHLNFGYLYYLHQLEGNPHMERWLEERTTAKEQLFLTGLKAGLSLQRSRMDLGGSTISSGAVVVWLVGYQKSVAVTPIQNTV